MGSPRLIQTSTRPRSSLRTAVVTAPHPNVPVRRKTHESRVPTPRRDPTAATRRAEIAERGLLRPLTKLRSGSLERPPYLAAPHLSSAAGALGRPTTAT